jgi:hypothetical protein
MKINMNINMKRKTTGAALAALALLATLLVVGKCMAQSKQEALREALRAPLQAIAACPGGKLALADVLPRRYAQLCLQSAYLPRDEFEKRSGKAAPGYEMLLHDGAVTWWLFESDGAATALPMPGFALARPGAAGTCFAREKSVLIVECHSNQASYKIEEQ